MYMKLRTPLSLLVQAVLFGESAMDGSTRERRLRFVSPFPANTGTPSLSRSSGCACASIFSLTNFVNLFYNKTNIRDWRADHARI